MTTALIILRRRLTAALAALALPVLAQAAPADPGVIVAEVRTAELVDRIEALGTLRANESVELTATVTETVTAIHFDDGDRVEAGQLLVEMTGTEERALLEEARSTVDEARRQYRRVQSLESQGTAARSLLDERRRDWETARARLAAIESRLADRLIEAPFAGVVGLRDLSPGALVEPGDLITTLDDDSVMKLELAVPATYLGALEPGLPVAATARAYGPREFQGAVKAVDSRVDPATRSIRVRALIPNPQRLLKPGMLMQVELLEDARRAPVVPEEALMPEGRQQFVMVVDPQDGNRIERREIRIGARRPGEAEVVEGLEPGELVVTQGQIRVREGQQVSIQAVDDGTRPLRELVGEYGEGGPP